MLYFQHSLCHLTTERQRRSAHVRLIDGRPYHVERPTRWR
jgi:hypothetical protein